MKLSKYTYTGNIPLQKNIKIQRNIQTDTDKKQTLTENQPANSKSNLNKDQFEQKVAKKYILLNYVVHFCLC